jgi:transmembrane sensor
MSFRSPTSDEPARRSSVAEDAAEWLATLTDPSCTDDERQSFVAWLRRSNLHVEEFLLLSMLTQRLTRPEVWPPANIEELIAQAVSNRVSISRIADPGTPRTRASSRAGWPRWLIAACTVPVTAVLALLIARLHPLWLGDTYTTAIGELRSITLEDGSVLQLNSGSSVRARFTDAERVVALLRGEAIFKVAKNPEQPFHVYTGSTDIVAVGTQFNVYAHSTRTVVTVLEGRVRVTDKATQTITGNNLELARGEQAVIAPNRPIARRQIADSRQVTAWTERRLIFDDTPLSTAADEFARYNVRRIRVGDAKLAELRITGVFDATDPASLVQFVEAYGGVTVQTDRDGWTLLGTDPQAQTL